jgi:hypothetical protein
MIRVKEPTMSRVGLRFVVSAVASAALAWASMSPAAAGGFYTGSVPAVGGGAPGGYGGGGGGGCHGGGGSTIIINKNINIFKPVNINKNININKNVIINKVNVEASAFAQALAAANAGAQASVVIYGGGSYEYVNVRNEGGAAAAAAVAGGRCEMQEASVVKSIHAVCVAGDGREFPASHMTGETWIDQGYEGEIARCIAGSHLKIIIGDVLQSDQGMAGTYAKGVILECGEHEAVRHFKGGMLKCAPAMAVPDCTERTNLRKWGTGDMFFTYRTTVCAMRAASREVELDNAALGSGGVGGDGGY